MASRKVAVWLPSHAKERAVEERWDLELEALSTVGAEIVEVRADDAAGFVAGAKDADALMSPGGGYAFDSEVIAGVPNCVVIGVGSVGLDRVDVEAATDAGIIVTNVPDVFIEEVADHAMMLILAAARRLNQMGTYIYEDRWREALTMLRKIPRLWGQTLGFLSFGNIACATARRARPFGFHLIAHDPYVSELKMTAEQVEPVSFDELFERADYLSVHTPYGAETHHMVAAEQFAAMKPSAVIVNTARGGILDEAALIEALRDGEIAYAALDVLEEEPASPDNPILHLANAIVTPHVASATSRMERESRRRVSREIALVLAGRRPISWVNPSVQPRASLRM